jgi:hypothetical protein
MLGYAGVVCLLECFMVTADTACDALVVGLTKAEGEEVRGTILANAYTCRFTAAMLSSAAIAALYDGFFAGVFFFSFGPDRRAPRPREGGRMAFSLTLSTWWAIGIAPAALMLVTGFAGVFFSSFLFRDDFLR